MVYRVALIVGSLREASWSHKLARTFVTLAPAELTFALTEIGDLPFMNEDLESSPPAQWVRFRDDMRRAHAVLFVTPEYNRGVPGVLKNAIDVGSRPYAQNVFSEKPAAIVSASIGALGGFGANHHLRQSLAFLNMPTLPAEAYIGTAQTLFDANGALKDAATTDQLRRFATAFARWIEDHHTPQSRAA